MRYLTRCTVIMLAAGLAVAPTQGQDWVGKGRVQGRVTDEQGDPVAGASVTLHLPDEPDAGPEPLTTDGKGKWSYLGLKGGLWEVEIDAEGYVVSTGVVDVNEFKRSPSVNVELRRNPYAFIQEGEALLDAGDAPGARALFEQGMAGLEPEAQAQLRALIGDSYYQEQDFERARDTYRQAIPALEPDEAVHVRIRLADACMQLGDFAAARGQYEQTLPHLGPDGSRQVRLAIAQSHDQEGERDRAVATLEQLLAEHPDDPQALQLIADLLSRAGREDEAQEYLARIPETAELPPDMLLNMGIRQYNDGEYEDALANFERVVQQRPDLADAYYYRGLLMLSQGDNDAARADLERLLELDPDSPYAAEARDFLEHLRSNGAGS